MLASIFVKQISKMARRSKGSYFNVQKNLWDSNINSCTAVKLIHNVIAMINAALAEKNICILSPAFNGAYLGSSMYVSLIKQCSFSCSVLKRFSELLYFDFFFHTTNRNWIAIVLKCRQYTKPTWLYNECSKMVSNQTLHVFNLGHHPSNTVEKKIIASG